MSPYHRSISKMAMASTMGGQRRILKHRHDSVIEYIRKAVNAGTYRTKEEIATIQKERKEGVEDLRIIMNRLRQDIVRGSHVQDYPTEYLILEQHPPIPDPPRIPKRFLKLQEQEQKKTQQQNNPIRQLTKKYLSYYEKENLQQLHKSQKSRKDGGPMNSTEYYRRLLGVQQAASAGGGSASSMNLDQLSPSSIHYKPAILQKAYTAAVLHHNIQQKQKQENEKQQHQSNTAATNKSHHLHMMTLTKTNYVDRDSTININQQEDKASSSLLSDNNAVTMKGNNSIMKQVNDMLLQQSIYEQNIAQERVTAILESRERSIHRSSRKTKQKVHDGTTLRELAMKDKTEDIMDGNEKHDKSASETNVENRDTTDSIFYSDPNTIEGMIRWSDRLQTVPYREWTIGASTALDHWVARQVLQLSELTWQTTLEGYDSHALSIGRDIITCREALFPETALYREQEDDKEESSMDDEYTEVEEGDGENTNKDDDEDRMLFGIDTQKSKSSSSSDIDNSNEPETRSIEDLLARLGGLRAPDAAAAVPVTSTLNVADMDLSNDDMDTTTDIDVKINQLVDELQNWRRRHVEISYDRWDSIDQDKFTAWMKKYVKTLSSDIEKRNFNNNIDWDETRIALLSEPPMSQEESDEFWNSLTDERSVQQLLDRMIKDGPPSGTNILHASFWDLPRNVQIQQLLNIGSIRPLLDEYIKETDRLQFIQRYGDIILAGVPLEHLVPDPSGPIKASDLSRDIVTALQINESERFRLEKLPFLGLHNTNKQQQEDQTSYDAYAKSRFLFKIWNEHKAGRARYEEKLYQTGRLGLRYGDEDDHIMPSR